MNNVKYLQWVQDIAVAHWKAAAKQEDQRRFLWVVLRHEIDYKWPTFAGDQLSIRTWVGSATKPKFERHTESVREADGKLVAKALTNCCPIDAETSKPVAGSLAVRNAFSESGGVT